MAEQEPMPRESPFSGRSFDRIAAGYDRANAAMTFGRSSDWVRNAARVALEGCPSPACGLDVATGTGGLAIELARLAPDAVICGLDISRGMVDVASARVERHGPGGTVRLLLGEALKLPFPDGTFDFAVSAYLLRNVGDLPAAFAEMARVTRPGGRVVAMDITPARGRGPLELVFQEAVGDRSAALQLEHRVKRLAKLDKEALVREPSGLSQLLSSAEEAVG